MDGGTDGCEGPKRMEVIPTEVAISELIGIHSYADRKGRRTVLEGVLVQLELGIFSPFVVLEHNLAAISR